MRSSRSRLCLESLEDRTMPATLPMATVIQAFKAGVSSLESRLGPLATRALGQDLPAVEQSLANSDTLALTTRIGSTFGELRSFAEGRFSSAKDWIKELQINPLAGGMVGDNAGTVVQLKVEKTIPIASLSLLAGADTGFSYFAGGAFNGVLKGSAAIQVSLIMGVDTAGGSPAFYLRDDSRIRIGSTTAQNQFIDGFTTSGQLTGSHRIKGLIAIASNVQATLQVTTAALNFMPVVGDRLRVADLARDTAAQSNGVTGSLNLSGNITSRVPLLGSISWVGTWAANFVNGSTITTDKPTAPSEENVLVSMVSKFLEARDEMPILGPLADALKTEVPLLKQKLSKVIGLDDTPMGQFLAADTATISPGALKAQLSKWG